MMWDCIKMYQILFKHVINSPILLEFCLGWLTFEVQYFCVILPALDTVWVTILPSSGIHGPQIPPCFCEDTRQQFGEISFQYESSLFMC